MTDIRLRPLCAEIPIDPTRERDCTEPYHWDDGVPYCDTCGLYRDSVARRSSISLRNARLNLTNWRPRAEEAK